MAKALVGVGFIGLVGCWNDDPGRAAYMASGCPRCHGSDLRGSGLGPPLTGVGGNWDEAGLEAFLTRPDSFRVLDQRLALLAEQFPSPMPAFVMPDSLRSDLVAYLILGEK